MMGLFGRKKDGGGGREKKAKRASPAESDGKAARDAPVRNDEVTVQIEKQPPCLVATAMATHIGTRSYQQDAAYVCEPLYEPGVAFGILCDGMGGMAEGERASSDVAAFLANRIAAMEEGGSIPKLLEQAAIDANGMVLARNRESGQDSGTTLIAAVLRQDEMFWLNVGDSRIYIIRGGEIARVSRDHNFALELQEMVRAGKITQQQADTDPRKDALVSYIGAPVLEMVDVNRGSFKLHPGDVVLLCSDGLTKVLRDEEILAVISQHGGDIAEAARALPLTAFGQSPAAMDNTSVILMQYFGSAQ